MFNKQLLIVAFFIVMLELLFITFIIGATKNKIEESLISVKFGTEKTLAAQIAHSLKQDLGSVEDLLKLAAMTPEIQSDKAEECQAKLTDVFPIIESKIANLVRINEKGDIYCAVNRASIGINVLKDKDLEKLIKTPEHQPTLHRIVFSPVSKKYVVGIHVPVTNKKGEFKGSIGGVVYLDELKDKYFKEFALLEKGVLFVIDDNGDVLYHQKSPQIIGKNLLSDEIKNQISRKDDYVRQVEKVLSDIKSNKASFANYHYPPNPEMIAAYYPVEIFPDRHWAVVVSESVEDIVNQVDNDSLVAGFKNFSTLSIAMITIVMVTQISLFIYLITHLSRHIKRMESERHG